MKISINISQSSDTVMTNSFYTFNELLANLGLQHYSVVGQPIFDYDSVQTVMLENNNKVQTIIVHRDKYGYTAELSAKSIMYYVVDKFNRVIKGFKSTDSIPATILKAIRYRWYKHTEWNDSMVPCKIYRVYNAKHKTEQVIKDYLSVVEWYECKNASRTREY